MKTRYTPLVSIKKNVMQKSERVVQQKQAVLNTAKEALQAAKEGLKEVSLPQEGKGSEFLSMRMLLDSQRELIRHNEEWVAFAQKELVEAREQLKADMIEYEKFQYLELQEIQKIEKELKIQEAKALDEVALISFNQEHIKAKR